MDISTAQQGAVQAGEGRWPPRSDADLVQVLQWIRCYEYQSCDDPNWNSTFAYHYTQRLIDELVAKVIACFATTWTYDGPRLT